MELPAGLGVANRNPQVLINGGFSSWILVTPREQSQF